MKAITIFQRLNLALALTIVLLLGAVGLALWVQEARTGTSMRQEQLSAMADRLCYDVLVMCDALRTLSADPKNEAERNRRAQAEEDFRKRLRSAQETYAVYPELVDSLKAMNESSLGKEPGTLGSLQSRLLPVLDSDSPNGLTMFSTDYKEAYRKRDFVFNDLTKQVAAVSTSLSLKAQRSSILGWAGILVILAGCAALLWFSGKAITDPLKRLVSAVDQMREGDLSKRAPSDGADELGALSRGVNRLADDLCEVVGHIQRSSAQLDTGAEHAATTARNQESSIRAIASTLDQVGAASKEICSTSKDLVERMKEVNEKADETASLAGSGQAAIARTEAKVRQVVEASGSVGAKLAALSDKTANINSVVATITKIADQTNLLSLNAAIEAEKAGEYGLGFAVVAVEIRRLADQTAVATYDIEKTVKEMQAAVSAGVSGMDKFSEELRRGAEEVQGVSSHLAQIIERVQILTPRFQVIHGDVQAQLTKAQQINDTLGRLTDVVQRTAESLHTCNAALEQLHATGAGLQASTSRFKLNSTPGIRHGGGSGNGL